jgi:hypothetical protein
LSLESAVATTPCFKVYDERGKLTYEGRHAPVDLRDANSASWAQLKLRSEHLLWYTSENCQADRKETARSTVGRDADAKGNAELILSRTPAFAGR